MDMLKLKKTMFCKLCSNYVLNYDLYLNYQFCSVYGRFVAEIKSIYLSNNLRNVSNEDVTEK